MKKNADRQVKTPFFGSESLDSLPLPVMLISADCILLAANKKAHEVFSGFEVGTPLSSIFSHQPFLDACTEVMEKNEARECEIVQKRRGKRYFQATISPFQVDEGDGAYIAIYETTSTREAERMRASFVADVSHELRSPLTTLIATIETLRGRAGAHPETRTRFISLMAQETERMHSIVDDLLSLSATEAVEHILPDEEVNLAPLLRSIASALAPKADTRGMSLVLKAAESLPNIRGSHDELYQAIYNLAENALKYGKAGTDVTLSVTGRDGMLRLQVHNWGKPIPAKHIPRLTERFYRADKSRTRTLGGTGLGLAIVKHIVNRHQGELYIESDDVEGTRFSISFPALAR